MKPRTLSLVLALSVVAPPVLAADAPYAGQQTRAIKALTGGSQTFPLEGTGFELWSCGASPASLAGLGSRPTCEVVKSGNRTPLFRVQEHERI